MNRAQLTDLSEYELQIQRNVEERKKMFKMLQLNEAKKDLVDVLVKPYKLQSKLKIIDHKLEGKPKLAIQVKSTQFGLKKNWYESSIMKFYQFSEETRNKPPYGKQDVMGVCVICEEQITGQMMLIRNWKSHLQNCHQEVPEWKEYTNKTLEIKEQRMKNSNCTTPWSSPISVQKVSRAEHILSPQPQFGMLSTIQDTHLRSLTEVPIQCHNVSSSLPSPAPCQPDFINEYCMLEDAGLLIVKSEPPARTMQTRGQRKRIGAYFKDDDF